jgi:hypothetical protein
MVEGVEGFEAKLQCLRFRNFGDFVTVGQFPGSYKVRLGGIHAHECPFCALSSSAASRCLSGATREC